MLFTRVRFEPAHSTLLSGVPHAPRRVRSACMLTRGGTVRLQIHSNFEMLDFVQVVSDRMGQLAGLDEDAVHWIGVAVRESVINAIKHGNREDYGKLVTVEFALAPVDRPERAGRPGPRSGRRLRSRRSRRSPGPGEHPQVERPRHLFHAQLHGRRDPPARSRRGHGSAHGQEAGDRCLIRSRPVYLATAIEAVIRAGEIQLAALRHRHARRQEGRDRPRHRDRPADRARVPRDDRRALSRSRRARRGVRSSGDRDATPPFCWVFDPVDGTTNYAHGLPIFCSSLALEIDGEIVVGAVYDPTRRELFTAERGQGAWLNGRPLRVSSADALIDSLLVTGFHYGIQRDPEELVSLFREFITSVAGGPAARVRGARPVLRRGRPVRRLLGIEDPALGRRGRRADRRRSRRPRHARSPATRSAPAPAACSRPTAASTTSCSRSSSASAMAACSKQDAVTPR